MNTIKKKYLDQLLEDFQLMAEIVLSQIIKIGELLSTEDEFNKNLFKEVERNEKLIDGLDIKIKEEVISSIFLFLPRAIDLRSIVAYYDMSINLERISDITLNISRSIKNNNLKLKDCGQFKEIMKKMLTFAEQMIKNAVIAFTCNDSYMAYETIETDNKVDELYWEISEKLPETFKDKALSEQEIKNIIGISKISYNIERIADYATNIAESAVYLTEGKDIRHD